MDGCPSPIRLSDDFQIIHNVSTSILLVIDTAIFIDANIEGCGEGINNRRAYPVKTTRNLVATSAEFSSRVKHGKDSFNGRSTRLFLDIYWDPTTIVDNCDRIIYFNENFNMTSKTGQGFVNRVIYDFPDQVMKTFF